MTILSVVQAVANECGYTVGSTVIGSTDATTVQLLAMANRVNKEMCLAYEWNKLFGQATITTVPGQSLYAVPTDFSYYHYDTFWNQSTKWALYGPLSIGDYGTIQGYGLVAYPYQQFQFRGLADNQIFIYPTPTSTATIIFQYARAKYVRPKTWTTGTAVTAIGSYIFYNGNYYISANTGTTGVTPPTWTTGTQSDGGISWTYYNGNYTEFAADTDVPILSQRVLEQGVLERFAEIHGLPVEKRFENQLNEEYSRAIPATTLYAGGYGDSVLVQARQGVVSFGRGFNNG